MPPVPPVSRSMTAPSIRFINSLDPETTRSKRCWPKSGGKIFTVVVVVINKLGLQNIFDIK